MKKQRCVSFRLEIEAADEGSPVQTSRCTLKISVIDVNDNAPFFPAYAPVTVSEGNLSSCCGVLCKSKISLHLKLFDFDSVESFTQSELQKMAGFSHCIFCRCATWNGDSAGHGE